MQAMRGKTWAASQPITMSSLQSQELILGILYLSPTPPTSTLVFLVWVYGTVYISEFLLANWLPAD